jgi:hypothetical protein
MSTLQYAFSVLADEGVLVVRQEPYRGRRRRSSRPWRPGRAHNCKLSGCRPHACKPMKANTIRQIHSILSGAFVAARELFMDAENLSWFATEETACS